MQIPEADRQLLPPLSTQDICASGFKLQVPEFRELGKLTIQFFLEGNLFESLIESVSRLVQALSQAECANLGRN
ncbi:MAG: hypothetical protein EZS28_042538 [Streblomastix strix]|uniref:Uncharacterized protein n=1 Tax=Streblomastix strix TaxID=222440 RepID=A0A5J4TUJ4_9EUKA|nr:MAG: hypothetical protein EZS28_042538 [Streblomastix strix]